MTSFGVAKIKLKAYEDRDLKGLGIQAHRVQCLDRFLDVEYQNIWKSVLNHYLRKVG